MNEQPVIKSERYNVKRICLIAALIGVLVGIGITVYSIRVRVEQFHEYYDLSIMHTRQNGHCSCRACDMLRETPTAVEYVLKHGVLWQFLLSILVPALFCGLLYILLCSYELVVTDKRVYGRVVWGRRVDLPVDVICAIATARFWKGISVSTASGKISFLLIKNVDAVYHAIGDLLVRRQQEKPADTKRVERPWEDRIEQIRAYKRLLGDGILSQEEFETKKKQLLDP